MTTDFRRSGVLQMLEYGKTLASLLRSHYDEPPAPDPRKRREHLENLAKAQQFQLVLFFETEREGKSSPMRQFICRRNETTKVSIPRLSVISLCAFRAYSEDDELVTMNAIIKPCSLVDPEHLTPMGYRSIIGEILVAEAGVLTSSSNPATLGICPSIGLGVRVAEIVFGGKGGTPFLTDQAIAEKRAAREKKKLKSTPGSNTPVAIPLNSPKDIEAKLSTFVVGHEAAVRSLSVRLSLHLKKAAMIMDGKNVTAPNEVVLLIGSSSSGKTHLATSISKILTINSRPIPYYAGMQSVGAQSRWLPHVPDVL